MSGRTYILRDNSGNQYVGSSLTIALQNMPEQSRGKMIRPTSDISVPEQAEDIWNGNEDSPQANIETVYHA